MANVQARSGFGQVEITAVITRADGTVEDLGTVSYWHKNPFRRLAYRLRRLIAWLRSS
jgi:hypothetical protein